MDRCTAVVCGIFESNKGFDGLCHDPKQNIGIYTSTHIPVNRSWNAVVEHISMGVGSQHSRVEDVDEQHLEGRRARSIERRTREEGCYRKDHKRKDMRGKMLGEGS